MTPDLSDLSDAQKIWFASLALYDEPPTLRDFDAHLREMAQRGVVERPPSQGLGKVLTEAQDLGILVSSTSYRGDRVWSTGAARWALVRDLQARDPGLLAELAAFRSRTQHLGWVRDLGHWAHRLVLGVALDGPPLDEALARLEPLLLLVDRGEFEYGVRTCRHLGLGVRMALANGTWPRFSPGLRDAILQVLAYHTVIAGAVAPDLAAEVWERTPSEAARDLVLCTALVAGDLQAVRDASPGATSVTARSAATLAAFLSGEAAEGSFVRGPLFPWMACLALGTDGASPSKVKSFAADQASVYAPVAQVLWAVFRHRGKAGAGDLIFDDLARVTALGPVDQLLVHLGLGWNGLKGAVTDREIEASVGAFGAQGAGWYRLETLQAAKRLGVPGPWDVQAQTLGSSLGFRTSLAHLGEAAPWEAALKRLEALKVAEGERENTDQLCWLIDPARATARPVLRRRLRSGAWSVPKEPPMTKVARGEHPAVATEDRPVLKAYRQGPYAWDFDHKRALEALAGHPRVFLEADPDTAVVLEAAEVELRADEGAGGLRLSLSVPLDAEAATLVKLGPAHFQVLVVPEALRKVAEVVGTGLVLPPEARPRVVEVLGHLAKGVQVRSPLLKENRQTRVVEADPRPVVLLAPHGPGLGVEVHVRPLGPGTPLLRPGEGSTSVHVRQGDGLVTTTRDLEAEVAAWDGLLDACPQFAAWAEDWSLVFADPQEALAVVADLRDAGAVVEWPQGGKFAVHRLSPTSLRLSLGPSGAWFAVSGEARLDEDRVINYQELLGDQPPQRFVRLADGDWVELEAQLVRQLEHLQKLGPRIPRMAAASSDLLLDEGITQAAGEAQAWRQRWKAGVSPSLGLPTSLAADLRPYQLEGFRWLARLSEVGAGACLADDMGLGKTVQTIALLAHRAALGPALVLAPTSVAPNWRDEIRRFDRTLEPVLLAEGGREDRHRVVAGLGPGQVLVATYGLLVTERDLLAGREWSTLVLDEAQAVKNAQAQRTKAALTLKAAFRLALTGTPLQNHLGELWSLFEFLNPGLLGTKTSFQDRFWGPIEGKKDEGARRSLQALVRPFLLRRTKNQVLGDLPAKIEATLAVDLGPEERDWYEALRRQALLEMTEKPNQHLQVLAHLMRLRRACCHSTLAGGPATSSAKLDRLEQLLEDLIDNGHRTLVFSQFTDHLALIRQRVQARGWAWEELDGSTPSAERTSRVARFQGGQTPIFLISLQAGGTGLNLTGADYVVHMDPWWNPAVEDQASDRAHRLGQTRPVTIYRLVARDTIEERIVELHHTKRDLADALLEGTEAAGRLGPDELMALIAGQGVNP